VGRTSASLLRKNALVARRVDSGAVNGRLPKVPRNLVTHAGGHARRGSRTPGRCHAPRAGPVAATGFPNACAGRRELGWILYAQRGRELVGCKSAVRKQELI
jgi:hypothetical protein